MLSILLPVCICCLERYFGNGVLVSLWATWGEVCMNEPTEQRPFGTALAEEVTQLLEHATKQWEWLQLDMSSCDDLSTALPDVAIIDSD